MSRLAVAITLAALAPLAAHPAAAQGPGGPAAAARLGPGTRGGEPRLMGGLAFALTQPVHEFHDAVPNRGLGGVAHALFRDRSGALALRADVGFTQYGRERFRVPLGTNRVRVDAVTTNNIVTFGVGPQLMAPSGAVRPYVNGNVGFALFSTTSELRDRNATNNDDDDNVIARDRNQADGTWAGGGGGGFLVRLGRPGGRQIAFLDLGARYQNNGRARYLTRGGIRDNPDGTFALDVRESRANFWTYQIGVSLGGR
jgi:hypothetical protein